MMEQAEVDCVYTKTGSCEDCNLPENKNCPYENEEENSQ